MGTSQSSAPSRPSRLAKRGPVSIGLTAVLSIMFAIVMSWLVGMTVEIVGLYVLWPVQGIDHAKAMVDEDLAQLSAYPSCAVSNDTMRDAQIITNGIANGFTATGLFTFIQAHSTQVPPAAGSSMARMQRTVQVLLYQFARLAMVAFYVAQNIAVRLAVVVFALPFLVATAMLAIVDGLVRRDLRKWSGGRESSFVYHHAKGITAWSLSGGFAIYLAWPFAGMPLVGFVLGLCLLAALAMSITVSSFKKYL